MITAQNISLSFGDRVILDDISLTLMQKDRIALVGENGAGKSSLLNILESLKPNKYTLGFLKQVPDLDKNLTVWQTVNLGLAEHLVNSMLDRLGIKNKDQLIGSLSGGERRRVDLARILLKGPDIYLLDEPTNHLDIFAINFLVDFLKKSNAAILFVSHDQRFIDELATRILELEKGKIYWHEPPFSNYIENKVIRELVASQTLHRRERLMANELSWLRAGTKARTTKQNARIDRAYELMDTIVKDSKDQRTKKLQLATVNTRLGNTILELDRVGIKVGERVLFKDFSLKVTKGSRYGILGPNGAGKTSFLSMLSGSSLPSFGRVILGKNTKVLKFDQHREELSPNTTLKETLADHGEYVHIDGQNIHISSYLEKYLFSGSDANRRVSSLSGGEQNRLLLAKMFRHSSNCLLLDEPTNDLDVSSLAVLEEILLDYEGVVFLVSHDRGFLDRVCNHIIEFSDSKLTVYTGNFSSYLEQKAKENNFVPKEIKKIEKIKPDRVKIKTKRSFKEEQEFKNIENIITSLECERSNLQEELLNVELFKNNPKLASEKTKRLSELDEEIDRLYQRWQELDDIGGEGGI